MTDELNPPPPRKQRMGTTAPGGADGASTDRGSHGAAPAGRPAAKTRMGAAPPAAAAPAPSTPTATGSAPRARMGANATVAARTAASVPTPPIEPKVAGPRPTGESPPAGAFLTRVPRKRMLAVLVVVAVAVVLVVLARWLRTTPDVQSFIREYPGHPTLPDAAPTGLPAWLGWQHFLNMFFMVLIVRTGLQVRHERKAPAHWTPKSGSFFSPKWSTPKKVSLSQWVHQALDVLWVANGLVFFVLLAATSQWMRIVPTSWDVVPNALSAALQYASLDWPTEDGWAYYNALQLLAYFATVFIAAPLAVLSGIRFSTWWPDRNTRVSKVYPIEIARAVHYPVMLYFVAFTVVHVFLVFFTGALRNLNHMYASRDLSDWIGLAVFAVSLAVVAGAWILTKPLFMRPAAGRFGTLSK